VTWGQDNAHDLDLGSTQPALLPDGVLLIVGKRRTGHLLRASHLGGVGGQIAVGSRRCRWLGRSPSLARPMA
jgi:hypothetical protein